MSERPKQWQADVAEIVSAYDAGGQKLAQRTYAAIIEARKLILWVKLALANDVRRKVARREG